MKDLAVILVLGAFIFGHDANALITAEAGKLTRPWLREAFESAKENKRKVQELIATVDQAAVLKDGDCPAYIKAYYGALKTLEAKYSKNVVRKFEVLNYGLRLLDEAVLSSGDDLEPRFVRYATLHHLPSFLTNQLKRGQDQEVLCQQLSRQDFSIVEKNTQIDMLEFLLASDRLNAEQTARIQKLHKDLAGR